MATVVGPASSNADRFKFIVQGKGSHASCPHKGVDSILVVAHLVTSLDSLITRNISPYDQAVIMVGKINGGTAPNIMANKVEIEGTVRTKNQDDKKTIIKRMEELAKGVGQSFGA